MPACGTWPRGTATEPSLREAHPAVWQTLHGQAVPQRVDIDVWSAVRLVSALIGIRACFASVVARTQRQPLRVSTSDTDDVLALRLYPEYRRVIRSSTGANVVKDSLT